MKIILKRIRVLGVVLVLCWLAMAPVGANGALREEEAHGVLQQARDSGAIEAIKKVALGVHHAPAQSGQTAGRVRPSVPSALAPVLAKIQVSEYRFFAGEKDSWWAVNRPHDLRIVVRETGIEVSPRRPGRGNWSLGLSLKAFGRDGAMIPAQPTRPEIQGNRTRFDRGNLIEWYVNDANGLEQGFTITAPFGDSDSKLPLRLELAITGEWNARLIGNSQAVQFVGTKEIPLLSYAKLKAWDALDRKLPVQLALRDGGLTFLLEDTDAVYPVTIDPLLFTANAKLLSADRADGDKFGASVGVSGNVIVIGASFASSCALGGICPGPADSGAVYLYQDTSVAGDWSAHSERKLTADDAANDDQFGASVAIDGRTIVVGAYLNEPPCGGICFPDLTDSGAVYIYQDTSVAGDWSAYTEVKLIAGNRTAGDAFGASVAIDGDTIVVGAPLVEPECVGVCFPDLTDSGAAFVFEDTSASGDWSAYSEAKLTASDPAADNQFGLAVSVSGDFVVVGAPFNDAEGNNAGRAYVFERPLTGWINKTEDDVLSAIGAAPGDEFGFAVSVSGTVAVVGAPKSDIGQNLDTGLAHVFERGDFGWDSRARLFGSDILAGHVFGSAVAVNGDTAVIGAPLGDGIENWIESGAAYMFEKPFGGWWVDFQLEDRKLEAADANPDDELGFSVALSADTVVMGAPFDEHQSTCWPDCIPVPPDPVAGTAYVELYQQFSHDTDGDGIADPIDEEPATFSDDFSDVALGGELSGTITKRADRTWFIRDAQNPADGVRVIIKDGFQEAQLTVPCHPLVVLTLSENEVGANGIVTCGSATVEGIEGTLDASVTLGTIDVTATIVAGTKVTFELLDPDTLTVASDPDSTTSVTLTVDGVQSSLSPGSISTFTVPESQDSDGDGVPDTGDNCIQDANADQRDTNGDGYGNMCDGDLNNDGILNSLDLGLLRLVFMTNDADADLNGDGYCNSLDLGIYKSHFMQAPGPSGLVP